MGGAALTCSTRPSGKFPEVISTPAGTRCDYRNISFKPLHNIAKHLSPVITSSFSFKAQIPWLGYLIFSVTCAVFSFICVVFCGLSRPYLGRKQHH